MNDQIVIKINCIYSKRSSAKLSDLNNYVAQAMNLAGEGNEVVLTGQGPIWLYLKIAHALHGVARKLIYRNPVIGDMVVFDHSPE